LQTQPGEKQNLFFVADELNKMKKRKNKKRDGWRIWKGRGRERGGQDRK